MVQTYSYQCIEVAKKVLKRMRRNDLVHNLSTTDSGSEDVTMPLTPPLQPSTSNVVSVQSNLKNSFTSSHAGLTEMQQEEVLCNMTTELFIRQQVEDADFEETSENKATSCLILPELPAVNVHTEDMSVPLTPPPQPDTSSMVSVQSNLKNSFPSSHAGLTEMQQEEVLCNMTPELFIGQHDVTVPLTPPPQPNISDLVAVQSNLQNSFKCSHVGWTEMQQEMGLCDMSPELFITDGWYMHNNTPHKDRNPEVEPGKPADLCRPIKLNDLFKKPIIRTVQTNGIAGIGKTLIVQKLLLEWAEKQANQDLYLIFPFSVRRLNMWRGETFQLAELIHTCIPETNCIQEETLNNILSNLQNRSEFKVLFVFDGLNESCLDLDFLGKANSFLDVTKASRTEVLITKLIAGKLLPSACIWITTQLAAANQIPPEYVDMVTEVRGFTDIQKEQYFRNRFREEEQANRIVYHIKTSQSLLIMCHIPVFCWITATVLEDVLKNREEGELPKTLTEMYIHFLVIQINKAKAEYPPKKCSQYIQSLAKLAFHQLLKCNVVFTKEDLRHVGINVGEASKFSALFIHIFRQVCGQRKDEDQRKMFCFTHLSIHEFLAAVHVNISLFSYNKNVMPRPRLTLKSLLMCFSKTSAINVYKLALDKVLESPQGHLDPFHRFLLGLSLPTNWNHLQDVLTLAGGHSQANQKTIKYIKKKIRKSPSPGQSIVLFHCLNELNDCSLVEEIQQSLRSGYLSPDVLSPAQWSALVLILLSSEPNLDVFDLKKYSASEKVLLRLLPLVKASSKALLNCCNLSVRSCDTLSSVLSSQSSSLRDLDLSNNDLRDTGVKLLSDGLQSPHCALETLWLSGCMITEEGCASLASALSSNPYHLRELDLSYNHLGDTGSKTLRAGLEDPRWRLDTLRLDHGGQRTLRPGLKKYAFELQLDPNTAHRNLKVSGNNRKVTAMEYQSYPDHPDRFDQLLQLLCRGELTGRCYWEVKWRGCVDVAVTFKGIRRKGNRRDCVFGQNNQSWILRCSDLFGFSVWHNSTKAADYTSCVSHRVAVYVDCPAGSLSFYSIFSDSLIHLHTFNTTFTEPLCPGFGFESMLLVYPNIVSSVSLSSVD